MEEDISLMNVTYTLTEVYEVFEDILHEPSAAKVKKIISEYMDNPQKTMYGYFIDKKIIGILGLHKKDEVIEIEHLGIPIKHKNRECGEKLLRYVQNKYSGKKIIAHTDKKGTEIYEKCGYKIYETEEDTAKEHRKYRCELN
jgi:N-acetylglutamate synthase-like GNAT family acetyltransferase